MLSRILLFDIDDSLGGLCDVVGEGEGGGRRWQVAAPISCRGVCFVAGSGEKLDGASGLQVDKLGLVRLLSLV